MAAYNYGVRARELMLPPDEARAFVALNEHADAMGTCPSCGEAIDRFEATRVGHARRCALLLSDAAEEPQASRGPVYNPVVKSGTYELRGVRVRAIDVAEAKVKIARKLGVEAYWTLPEPTVIVPTQRRDDAKGVR
jgi:hypothetical protein